jgi:hypothetical protein
MGELIRKPQPERTLGWSWQFINAKVLQSFSGFILR